jgi:phenylalanyl-tRNA synthetase beta chain
MKFPLSWLREHLDTTATIDQLTTTLSAIGIEVEGVEDRRAPRALRHRPRDRGHAAPQCRPAARAARGHRRRARAVGGLRRAQCPHRHARRGRPARRHIPGTGITLKPGEIRGVKSEAMMLSLREMGLGEDHSGIVDLPEDAPVGARYVDYAGLDDPLIEIKVTPNRGDALSVRGVARDLAAPASAR